MAICLAVFLVSTAAAFGVASSYSQETPYQIAAGENGEAVFRLQNMMGGEDVTVRAHLKDGAGIAQMEDKEYALPFGAKGLEVPVKISVAEGTPVGTKYVVVANFQTVTPGEAGVVSFGTGMDVQLPVKVIAKPVAPVVPAEEEEKGVSFGVILLIIGVIVLLIIIWWLASRKKGSKKGKK